MSFSISALTFLLTLNLTGGSSDDSNNELFSTGGTDSVWQDLQRPAACGQPHKTGPVYRQIRNLSHTSGSPTDPGTYVCIPASGCHYGWLPVAYGLPAAHTCSKHPEFRQTVGNSRKYRGAKTMTRTILGAGILGTKFSDTKISINPSSLHLDIFANFPPFDENPDVFSRYG